MAVGTLMQTAVLAVLAAAIPGGAAAQSDAPGAPSIAVVGQGEASGPPDRAQISAGVQTYAATVVEASTGNQAVIDRIMQALEGQGIDEQDIQTANYSIWPEQDRDPRRSEQVRITGYRVSNVVNVTVDDIDSVGEVLAVVTNAGANSIRGVHFGVKDTAALAQRARAAAMADARAQAEALAQLAGVELGDVLRISMSAGDGRPVPMTAGRSLEMAAADAPVPGISPGQLSVDVRVHVTYAIRQEPAR